MLLTIWLAGCGPTDGIEVRGVAPFGGVRSATWAPPDPIDRFVSVLLSGEPAAFDTPEDERDGFLRVDTSDEACADEQRTLERWAEASDAFVGAWDPADAATLCPAITAFLDARAASDRDPASNRLRVHGPVELVEGTFTLGEDLAALLVYERAGAPPYWASVRAVWDEAACALDAAALPPDVDGEDVWTIDGELVVDEVRDGVLVGTLGGDLLDAGGTGVGTIEATFSADHCPIADASSFVLVGI